MIIDTKFDVEDSAITIHNNRIWEVKIYAVSVSMNVERGRDAELKIKYKLLGLSGERVSDFIDEGMVFKSKQDYINSIM